MWKVGGIKIESAAGRRFFYQREMKIREKQKIFVNRSVTENFQQENFSGEVPKKSIICSNETGYFEHSIILHSIIFHY